MARYAQDTGVSAEKSRNEIERTLARYGADRFMYGWDGDKAMIAFRMEERSVRFLLPIPSRDDPRFRKTPTGRVRRDEGAAEREWEKATRQAWRALALVVKAKLEAVESGIAEFEDEFLAYIMLPGSNQTVGEYVRPEIATSYALNRPPQLALPSGDVLEGEVVSEG